MTRGTLAAWRAARGAVRARIHVGDYLRTRRAVYLARLPLSLQPLPKVIAVADDQLQIQDETARGEDSYPNAQTFQAAADRRGHPTYRTHIEEDRSRRLALMARQREAASAELTDLAPRLNAATTRCEQLKAEQDAEIAGCESLSAATERRSAVRRGRPVLPFPWGQVAYFLGTAGCLVAEAYQFAIPYFDVTGIDSTNLAAEWVRNPLGILTGAGFALGASGALFLFADQVVESGVALYRGERRGGRALATALWMVTLLGLVCGAAYGIGIMRHALAKNATGTMSAASAASAAGPTSESMGLFFLLTTMLPFGIAFLHQKVQATASRREDIRAEQRSWDAQEEQRHWTRDRREERLRQAAGDKSAIEQRQRELKERIERLNQDAAAIEKEASTDLMAEELALREQLAADRRYLLVFLNAAEAALEKDRYQFIKRASKRHPELLRSPRTEADGGLHQDGLMTADLAARMAPELSLSPGTGAERSNGDGYHPTLLQSSPLAPRKASRLEGGLS